MCFLFLFTRVTKGSPHHSFVGVGGGVWGGRVPPNLSNRRSRRYSNHHNDVQNNLPPEQASRVAFRASVSR